MSFNPPPPGDGTPPGEVPGYPGPSEFPPPEGLPAPYSSGGTPPHLPPPPYPGAPQYPGGQYGGMPQTMSHSNATVILVMGILGLVVCAPLGIVAWVMGGKALKEIDASGQYYDNRGTVQAGRIIGIIATIFLILQILFVVFLVGLGGFAAFVEGVTSV